MCCGYIRALLDNSDINVRLDAPGLACGAHARGVAAYDKELSIAHARILHQFDSCVNCLPARFFGIAGIFNIIVR